MPKFFPLNRPGFHAGSEVPRVSWSRVVGFSRHCRWLMSSLELDGCEHAKRGVAALAVVEDFQVFEDRVGEFDASAPAFAVEELDLHLAPERLDDGVVVAVTN
jgi:hypothetical protein